MMYNKVGLCKQSFFSFFSLFQLPTKFIRKRVIWMGKVFGHGLNMNWVGAGSSMFGPQPCH